MKLHFQEEAISAEVAIGQAPHWPLHKARLGIHKENYDSNASFIQMLALQIMFLQIIESARDRKQIVKSALENFSESSGQPIHLQKLVRLVSFAIRSWRSGRSDLWRLEHIAGGSSDFQRATHPPGRLTKFARHQDCESRAVPGLTSTSAVSSTGSCLICPRAQVTVHRRRRALEAGPADKHGESAYLLRSSR